MRISRRSFLAATVAAPLILRGRAADACGSEAIRVRKKYDLRNIDPADYYPDDEVITLAVFGSLIRKAADGSRQNHLTSKVEDHGQTEIRFVLISGAKWSNGAEVTANDVKYSFERIAGTALKARHREQWEALDRVNVAWPREGTLVLKKADPGIWDGALPVGCGCIVSEKAVEALTEKRFTVEPGPTAGRYRFVSRVGDEITLSCNSAWAGSKPAQYQTVVFKVIGDDDAALTAYRAGRIDMLDVPADLVERRAPELTTVANIVTKPSLTISLLGMNAGGSPFLKDSRIRGAIQTGLDVVRIVKGTYGPGGIPASGPVPLALPGSRTGRPVPGPNRERARKLLAEAGVPNGFEITLHAGGLMALAPAVVTGLAELGIHAVVKDQPPYAAKAEDVQLYLVQHTSTPDPAMPLRLFRSKRLPYTGFASAQYDERLEKATAERDVTKRIAEYRKLQDLLDDSQAFVWLAQQRTAWVFRKEISLPITPWGALADLGDVRRA
jgi:peptide/nickel transport system substrate-binding protein